MKQQSLEAAGFEVYRKKTRKEKFLDDMEQIIPWSELTEAKSRTIRKTLKVREESPSDWKGCCGFIFFTALV